MSQKDLLNLREKKDVYFIQNVDTPQQTLCGLCGFARKTKPFYLAGIYPNAYGVQISKIGWPVELKPL
jgi:hypothetical protein